MSDNSIPKPVDFLLAVPLYTKTTFVGMESWAVVEVLYDAGTYDSYCPKCQRDSTFQVVAPERPQGFTRNPNREMLLRQHGGSPELPPLQIGVYKVHSKCTRQTAHTQDFLFFIDQTVTIDGESKRQVQNTIEKIGQQPSYGDLHLPKVKKYASVLTKSQLAELSRATGLASHDVGVGSYVYLRRVFEALIEEAHQVAISVQSWDEQAYARSRMNEKISLLKGQLPTFLVEHPGMYSLMSKGVHELSEEECLKHFETLRIGIELILDEKLEHKERARKLHEAEAALQKAISDVKA